MSSKGRPSQVTSSLKSSIAIGQDHDVDDVAAALRLHEQGSTKPQRPVATAAPQQEETIYQKEARITNENLHRCEYCSRYYIYDKSIPSHLPNLEDAAISIPFPQYDGEGNRHLRSHIAVSHPHILKSGMELYRKWLEYIRARKYRIQLQRDVDTVYKNDEVRKAELGVIIARLTEEMNQAMEDEKLKAIIFHQDAKGATT